MRCKDCIHYDLCAAMTRAERPLDAIASQCNYYSDRSFYAGSAAEKPDLWGDGYGDDGAIIYDMYDCPKCGQSYEIDYEKYDYCPKCGQKMDWSDDNESHE